ILEELTPEAWVSAIGFARQYPANRPVALADVAEFRPEVQYVLACSIHRFGFPGADPRCMLRLILDAFAEAENVTYDLTDLVMGGYFESESDMIQYADI